MLLQSCVLVLPWCSILYPGTPLVQHHPPPRAGQEGFVTTSEGYGVPGASVTLSSLVLHSLCLPKDLMSHLEMSESTVTLLHLFLCIPWQPASPLLPSKSNPTKQCSVSGTLLSQGRIRLHGDGHHHALCPHPPGQLGSIALPGPREPAWQHTSFPQEGARWVGKDPAQRLCPVYHKPVAGGAGLSPEQLSGERALAAGGTWCPCGNGCQGEPWLASAPRTLRAHGTRWLVRKTPVPGPALPHSRSCWAHGKEEGTGVGQPAEQQLKVPTSRPAQGSCLAWGTSSAVSAAGSTAQHGRLAGMRGDQLAGGVQAEEGQMRSEQVCGHHKISDPLTLKKCF